ncbi:MAG TPA: hypothetical protein VF648_21295 [Pyrinomonadaceae bacterium]|jgi:hypothetical protein
MFDKNFKPKSKRNDEPGITPAALLAAVRGDLPNVIAASTPGGIERQEALGQREFVASSKFPRRISGATREQLEDHWGVKFCDDIDDLFVSVELPEGWKLEATDHSMHNRLLDDKSRVRASIFYKAAFYDRDASLTVNRRFSIHTITWLSGDKRPEGLDSYEIKNITPVYSIVKDCEQEIFRTTESFFTEKYDSENHWEWWKSWENLEKQKRAEAAAFLEKDYPDWENLFAYWD